MREYAPGEIWILVGHAIKKANDWLARQTAMLEENAEDLRRLIVTLSDKEQFDPVIWREGYDEIQAGASELLRAWNCLKEVDGPEQVQNLAQSLRGFEDYAKGAVSDFEERLKTLPKSVKEFDEAHKVFARKFSSERVIFIEIESVLIPFRWSLGAEGQTKDFQLDPGSVRLLVKLCKLANAKLVLSSTWRKSWPHGQFALVKRLLGQGLPHELWHPARELPKIRDRNKWEELAVWLDGASDVTALIIDEKVPDNRPILDAKEAGILEVDPYEGFGSRNYFDALDFFGVEDKTVKRPPALPPQRGVQSYSPTGSEGPRDTPLQVRDPDMITRPLRPYSPM